MIDVDHFNKFNDSHGHDVGDDVLVCRSAKHFGGDAYRFGGEEFCVLFCRNDLDAIAAVRVSSGRRQPRDRGAQRCP